MSESFKDGNIKYEKPAICSESVRTLKFVARVQQMLDQDLRNNPISGREVGCCQSHHLSYRAGLAIKLIGFEEWPIHEQRHQPEQFGENQEAAQMF